MAIQHAHHTTAQDAKSRIASRLEREGYMGNVVWRGLFMTCKVTDPLGFMTLVEVKGKITDTHIFADFGGVSGPVLEEKVRSSLAQEFPD